MNKTAVCLHRLSGLHGTRTFQHSLDGINIEPARIPALDDLFAIVSDKFPISPGHTLIIARRAVARFQGLTGTEKARLLVWLEWTQQHLNPTLKPAPDAFNFGLNDGPAADA